MPTRKNKNPLFVVRNKKGTKKGVVEQAKSWPDRLIKQFNLDTFWQEIIQTYHLIMDFLVGLGQVDKLRDWINRFVNYLNFMAQKI